MNKKEKGLHLFLGYQGNNKSIDLGGAERE